jgi:hypothetical protein
MGAIPGFYYQAMPKLLVYANAGGLTYTKPNSSRMENRP